jgi:hypothetical protein
MWWFLPLLDLCMADKVEGTSHCCGMPRISTESLKIFEQLRANLAKGSTALADVSAARVASASETRA